MIKKITRNKTAGKIRFSYMCYMIIYEIFKDNDVGEGAGLR